MKKTLGILLLCLFVSCSSDHSNDITDNFNLAQEQYSIMIQTIGDTDKNPRSIHPDGSLRLEPSRDWTSGFFPGGLWLLYEYTGDEKWKQSAQKFTENVEPEQFNGTTHDMGFKMYCSFGNGLRLTGDKHYQDFLLQSARTLITRFNPKVGCIRSWDHHQDFWQYPVIIDNMMNLELLFWAFKASEDSTFYKIAITHAETTMKNHFRTDYSSWHVLNYDTTNGEVLDRHTHQGAAHESSWARGQAWALYGFVMCYRETKDMRFLNRARHVADYILSHQNMPKDLIPYWDFNAPEIPHEERDASAAAIMCSALYELSSYSGNRGAAYRQAADKILHRLSSNTYRAKPGQNNNFILKHSVGSKPGKSEVDVPIIYADYYFLEANLRKLKLSEENH